MDKIINEIIVTTNNYKRNSNFFYMYRKINLFENGVPDSHKSGLLDAANKVNCDDKLGTGNRVGEVKRREIIVRRHSILPCVESPSTKKQTMLQIKKDRNQHRFNAINGVSYAANYRDQKYKFGKIFANYTFYLK